GGIIVPPDSYFPRIREICDQYDVLLVSDEIITGFGRTGKMFGLEHWGIEPDILQFAKGITSGYFPLGGIGLSDPVASVIEAADSPFLHAYTYNGHPVGCAVALANIALIQREGLVEQAAEKGRHLMDRLQNAFTAHPHAGDLRGKGLMCAVEFVANRETKASFAAEKKIGARIHAETQKRGLFSRVRGDSFFLAPPLTTDFTELDRVVDVLVESTTEILGR
ncbi:MAG: aminotransferase class III-fold pyridoxal phosphate-dependent enzyme, partial [Planctomycetota bacterium]|nr:aminotransferase class III-fold pyridoxal phosphate-dependent enzyme [Planctomycetota bacterium]